MERQLELENNDRLLALKSPLRVRNITPMHAFTCGFGPVELHPTYPLRQHVPTSTRLSYEIPITRKS